MRLTPQARAAAAQARRVAIQSGAHFRRDWADSAIWDELAKRRGIRLPQWHEAPTPGKLKFWLQTLVGEPFPAFYGEITPAKLIPLNPDMPLRAFVGQMLEAVGKSGCRSARKVIGVSKRLVGRGEREIR